jgi:hypothetical protein
MNVPGEFVRPMGNTTNCFSGTIQALRDKQYGSAGTILGEAMEVIFYRESPLFKDKSFVGAIEVSYQLEITPNGGADSGGVIGKAQGWLLGLLVLQG